MLALAVRSSKPGLVFLRLVVPLLQNSSAVDRLTSAQRMGNRYSYSEGPVYREPPKPRVKFTDAELRERLTPHEYHITQEGATEKPGTGKYLKVTEDGVFGCVVCGNVLFSTNKKFDSSSGWPSFSDVAEKGKVVRVKDESYGVARVEVLCANCGAHLGHVFEDGPKKDTGLRYCINSASLKFKSKADNDAAGSSAACGNSKSGGTAG